MSYYQWIESPVAPLLLTASNSGLSGLYLEGQKHFPKISADWTASPELPIFARAQAQLNEYFAQERQTFDLSLDPQGTRFQRQVWQYLRQIPFGETTSYGAIARALGKSGAAQAVGAANGRNPISIIVPCHRVVGSSGQMTGYAGGIDKKQWLLRHEQRVVGREFSVGSPQLSAETFQPLLALFE